MINLQNIKVPANTSLFIIGDMHEHDEQFFKLINEINPSESRWIVSVGDVYDKGWGVKSAEAITNTLSDFDQAGYGFAIQGNHEFKMIKKSTNSELFKSPALAWWKERSTVLRFNFDSGCSVLVVHGGVTPTDTYQSLSTSPESLYVRDIDPKTNKMIPLVWKFQDGKKRLVQEIKGNSWHELYDGRFGYAVAGHAAQKDGLAKFYTYSANIDSGVYETGILSCLEITSEGKRGKLIKVEGRAKKPELNLG